MSDIGAMIMTTTANSDDAKALSEILINTRAAACVQELGIHSHYRWEGRVNSDPEVLLLVKTPVDRVDFAVETIKANHKYEVPEILVVPLARALDAYAQWMRDETRPDGG